MRSLHHALATVVAFPAFFLPACGAGEPPDAELAALAAKAEAPVAFLRARSTDYMSWGGSSWTHSDYTILVQNLAYRKEVGIRKKAADGTWSDVTARHVGPADHGREIWRAELEESRDATQGAPDVEFAVWYKVNGQTHWDNNAGRNYTLKRGSGSLLRGGVNVLLYNARSCGPPGTARTYLEGQIDVRNLAHRKTLDVVYSDDHWATVRRAPATWHRGPNAEGIESWRFRTEDVNLDAVKFAVAYTVSGNTHWDNNFGSGRDYQLIPTTPTNPTCCSTRSADGAGDGNACWF